MPLHPPSPVSLAARRGLLGRLTRLADPQARRQRHRDEETAILAHLQALLNTRRGEAAAPPGLGLIDFADVVHGFPASTQMLVAAIRGMILAYEPRLAAVRVRPLVSEDALTLAFEISATLTSGRGNLRLRTELAPSGRFAVHRD